MHKVVLRMAAVSATMLGIVLADADLRADWVGGRMDNLKNCEGATHSLTDCIETGSDIATIKVGAPHENRVSSLLSSSQCAGLAR